MGYVGNQTTNAYTSLDKQTITGDGGASYTLDHAVANVNEIEVFVNNVRQEPSVAYTVSGTALTMTGNVEASDDFYVVFQGKAIQTVVPPSDSITTAMINDDAVTSAKINDGAVTTAKMDDNDRMVDTWYVPSDSVALTGTSQVWGLDDSIDVSQQNTYGYVGSSRMTESSGVFTFPRTGVYEMSTHLQVIHDGADTNIELRVQRLSSGAWSNIAYGRTFGTAANYYDTVTVNALVNITNTSTEKVRFEAGSANGVTVAGGQNPMKTYVIFKRLGDSV